METQHTCEERIFYIEQMHGNTKKKKKEAHFTY